jgi:hypothetical protein
METIASIVGTLLSPVIYNSLGYYGVYGISCAFLFSGIVYMVWLVPEPHSPEPSSSGPKTSEPGS